MPELPDLEVIAEFLQPRLANRAIAGVDVLRPLIVRDLAGTGLESLAGRSVGGVWRRGKFLVLDLAPGPERLALNPMLVGRIRYGPSGEKLPGYTAVVLRLAGGEELSYSDAKQMGKWYLAASLEQIPGFAELGPDALDLGLTLDVFRDRIRPYRGEIKGVLTRQSFVAGIGNAYADEICWEARVSPFRKRTRLSAAEIERVYQAMRAVLANAVEVLRARTGTAIHVEIRDFLAVHGKGGRPCPRCGTRISELKAQDYYTNFCRTCQPGTLIQQ